MQGLVTYPLLALAVIWIGYPLAVRLLGAWTDRATAERQRRIGDRVSIVLASAEDAPAIRERVADILATRHPARSIEVVVALDSANAKATASELSSLDERVRIVVGDAPGGKAAALNAAVRSARHELLVFTDTAQRFEPGAIGVLVEALGDARLGAVSGMLDLPGKDGSLNVAERYWRLERWLRAAEARLHSSVGVTGAIYAMPRDLWEPLPAGLILDDLYLPMRLVLAGWRVGFTERARARDVRRFAPAQEYRRKVRTLTGILQVCAWLPGVMSPVRNPIWFQFVFHKLLRLFTPYLAGLALIGIVGSALQVILSGPYGLELLATLAALALLVALVPRARRSLATQVAWVVALQSSIVIATVNGLRSKWNVWQ
jgi:cellulose synthase/poly-beta-1,6-N-acetylglucosamine synthase-like glycosyltransferase